MTTSAPHATIMTMQQTCAGHPSRHLNRVLEFVCIVAVQNIVQHNATIDHGIIENNHILHWNSIGTRNFNMPMVKILGNTDFQSSNTQGHGPVNHIHTGHTGKFWEMPVLTDQVITKVLSFLGKIRTTTVTKEGTHWQVVADTPLESNNRINMLIILVQISGIMGTSREDQHSPMLGLMRDTISNTLHPYTHPHLH